MDLGGETPTATLPNQHYSQLHSKYLFLNLQKNVVLTLHQGNVSLQRRETFTENHIHQNTQMRGPVPTDTSTT